MQTTSENLSKNVRRLREAHGFSQQKMSELSGIPRPTWASLESGDANPTLQVLHKAAQALQVSIEELVGPPRAEVRLVRAKDVKSRSRQGAKVTPLIPETLSGIELSHMTLKPRGRMTGVPHTQGTREYLTCESGKVELAVAGEKYLLEPGDMLVFRGDQKHGYFNPSHRSHAVAIAAVCFADR